MGNKVFGRAWLGFAVTVAVAGSMWSVPAAGAAVPVNASRPTISGTAKENDKLTAQRGTWTHAPTGYSYGWESCNADGNSCQVVGIDATAHYYLSTFDVGNTLRFVVTAKNASGTSAQARSAPTAVVKPVAPAIGAITITLSGGGQPKPGRVFLGRGRASRSSDNNPTTNVYQWEQCNASGQACVNITGAENPRRYVVQAVDIEHTLRLRLTATNAAGKSSATSAASKVVLPPVPTELTSPTVVGSAVQGQTLTVQPGAWTSGPVTPSDQWQDCDKNGQNCSNATADNLDATGDSYMLSAADVGHTIRVVESASNAGGTGAAATSAVTAVVLPLPPAATVAPSIMGSAVQGQTLTAVPGTWSNNPTSTPYEWEDCDTNGLNCVNITDANDQTYVLSAGDVGHTIVVEEFASNAGGFSAPAPSVATAVVLPLPPVNTAVPQITGDAESGATLTVEQGSWTNNPASFSHQWEDCDRNGLNCAAITGATGTSYVVTGTDIGKTIVVEEFATNAGGTGGPASSAATAQVR